LVVLVASLQLRTGSKLIGESVNFNGTLLDKHVVPLERDVLGGALSCFPECPVIWSLGCTLTFEMLP